MSEQFRDELKKRIIEEMGVDYSSALEKNFDRVKRFIRITTGGKVDVLDKEKLKGEYQIMLYLVGKLYAKEAGMAETGDAGYEELAEQLGMPEGSVAAGVKKLRDRNKLDQIKRERLVYFSIPLNLVERALTTLETELEKSDQGG